MSSVLTRYEVARLVGMRACDLAEGAVARVHVDDESLRTDVVYLAALELWHGKMDACVCAEGDAMANVAHAVPHLCLAVMLDARDGGNRSMARRT